MNCLAIEFFTRSVGRLYILGSAIDAVTTITLNRRNSESLPEILGDFLQSSRLRFADIDRVGVVTGPGAITPLRISVSMAQTLSSVLSVPLVGVSPFHLLARSDIGPHWVVLPGRNKRCLAQIVWANDHEVQSITDVLEQDIIEWIAIYSRFSRRLPVAVSDGGQFELFDGVAEVPSQFSVIEGRGFSARWRQLLSVNPSLLNPVKINYAYAAAQPKGSF